MSSEASGPTGAERRIDLERDEFLIPYWLRTVRIGTVVTSICIAVLAILPFLPDRGEIRVAAYAALLVLAGVGALAVLHLPWEGLFRSGKGIPALYAWSFLDIVLVTLAIGVSGGGHSELFILYALTTVFFATSYPPRGQVALLGLTGASYLAVLAVTGWEISAAAVFLRLSTLGTLTLLSSFLARELMRLVAAHAEARRRSDRWASLMSTVAAAARWMSLDPDRIVQVTLDAALGLGLDGASLCVLDEDGATYSVVDASGLAVSSGDEVLPTVGSVLALVLRAGRSVVLDEAALRDPSVVVVPDPGYRAVVATPLWVDGWMTAVLVGGTRSAASLSAQDLEAFELLASQAALAVQDVRRLEEPARAKSDFLAMVSHELRTPLTVIQGTGLTLERMWASLDEATLRELLEGLNANARSLDLLVSNLLDFSRQEEGRRKQFGPFDLSQTLAESTGRLRGLFTDRRLRVDVAAALFVAGDALLLDRVVENLLSNAVKHTPSGTVIELSAREVGGDVEVAVTDHGPGIPVEELPRLTEAFFRGGDAGTRSRGLGLGLALVRQVLDLHDTELQIHSILGSGSRFSFRLPVAAVLGTKDPGRAIRVP